MKMTEGYRRLERHEKVLPGDEFWGVYLQRWLPADSTVTKQYNFVYRRRLNEPNDTRTSQPEEV